MSELQDQLKPHIVRIIQNENNWEKEYVAEKCAYCNKLFEEYEVPFNLFKEISQEEVWSIQFHLGCAFFMDGEHEILSLREAFGRIKIKFLEMKTLQPDELQFLKDYVLDFLYNIFATMQTFNPESPMFLPNYETIVKEANQMQLYKYIMEDLLNQGIDPL